jgi:hypothetical protein
MMMKIAMNDDGGMATAGFVFLLFASLSPHLTQSTYSGDLCFREKSGRRNNRVGCCN